MPSSPPDSARGKIRRNLKLQLQTIQAGHPPTNGGTDYSRTAVTVSSNIKTWQQLPEAETPAIFVIGEDTTYTYHPGQLVEFDWKFSLYVVMKNAQPEDMDEFLSDITTCLADNQTLYMTDTGRVCSFIRTRSIITDDGFFLDQDGSNIAKVTISVVFQSCYGSR